MQPEDAGTPESGNTGRGTAAESAMKQTSKTDRERHQTLSMGAAQPLLRAATPLGRALAAPLPLRLSYIQNSSYRQDCASALPRVAVGRLTTARCYLYPTNLKEFLMKTSLTQCAAATLAVVAAALAERLRQQRDAARRRTAPGAGTG